VLALQHKKMLISEGETQAMLCNAIASFVARFADFNHFLVNFYYYYCFYIFSLDSSDSGQGQLYICLLLCTSSYVPCNFIGWGLLSGSLLLASNLCCFNGIALQNWQDNHKII